jgi:hypothetical protein
MAIAAYALVDKPTTFWPVFVTLAPVMSIVEYNGLGVNKTLATPDALLLIVIVPRA